MIRFAAILALLATPVVAQNTSAAAGIYVTIIEPDEHGRVGEIVHHNRPTTHLERETFFEWETERGRVTLRLTVTPNAGCVPACPDTLTVWELPEGIYADMLEVVTPEMETSIITLFLYSGA